MKYTWLALSLVCACNKGSSFKPNCTPGAASADAVAPAGRSSDGASAILPDGRKITPAGTVLSVGGFPLAMRVLPGAGQRYVVVTDGAYGDEHLRIVDTQAQPGSEIVSNIDYPRTTDNAKAPALFYGLALTADGKRLYVSDGAYDPLYQIEPDASKHYNVIEIFDLGSGAAPQLNRVGEIDLKFAGALKSPRLPAGMALSKDEQTLYVVTQLDGTLAVVDLKPGATQYQEIGTSPKVGTGPYDVALAPDGATAYVSLWGGQFHGAGDYSDGIMPVDVRAPASPVLGTLLPTGKAPEQMMVLDGKLFVTVADVDTITRFDTGSNTSLGDTKIGFDASGLIGSSPNALAADSAHDRLYVANANENAVEVFQLSTMQPLGRVPAAWYPTAVAVRADGSLLIAAGKGMGAGPSDHKPGRNDYMQGTLQVVPMPSAQDLVLGDRTAHDNLTRPKNYEVQLSCTGSPQKFALPQKKGDATPLKYVFLIVRENKTYDAVLGDQPGANGRADLALFGGDITPNIHALATRFANLDNFYSLAEQSLQGHEWTTAVMANDYTEKGWLTTWGRATRSPTAFSASDQLEHLAYPASKTAWEHLDGANIAYHNYGEIVNTTGALHLFDTSYPGVFFDIDTPDVSKIGYVIENLKDPRFVLEPFSYISLPNDHTYGTAPGKQTPQSMVADNDEATGRFIDALSHSSYWSSSITFIIEDDPQDGGDHVEMHRSPCVVISPWVKRGYVSSVHYDVPAMWHTLTRLLGVDPINQRDGNAPAMYDLFAQSPDATPYTFIPRKIPTGLNPANAPMANESMAIDFSRPDTAPLGRILWKAVKGADAEPPWGKKPLVDQHDDDD